IGLTALFFLLFLVQTTAQTNREENKKVTIITKKIDKDGKEMVETIVREGQDINDTEIDALIEKAKKEAKEINVRIEESSSKTVRTKEKEKTKNVWIEKDGQKIDLDDEEVIVLSEQDEPLGDGETMEVTVTVDEDGETKIIKKRLNKSAQNDGDVEEKLKELGITLPVLGKPVANYVHAVTSNNLVFLAGKGPRTDEGKNIVGKLGKDLTVEQGYEAARWAGINLLAALKGEIGDLNRVARIVKVKGMVNAVPEFVDHSKVINGFSDLMVAIFGDKGKHARAAVGMSSLPGNMAVEIEVVVEIE
ncbi:MAG: RidA family protein, partial [Bacteroidota bacterium]